MKILIVDDNAEDRQLLKLNIMHHGSEVIEAKDGLEGLELAGRQLPDLIISDGLMPKMDGFQFLRALKADPMLEPIPFVFYSASYAGEHEEGLALSLGAEAFAVKPMEPTELWVKICAIMDARKKQGDARKRKKSKPNRELGLEDYSRIVATKLEKKIVELEIALDRQKASELSLRDSERKLQMALSGSDTGWWSLDLRTDDGEIDERAAGILGREAEEVGLRRSDWYELTHPDDRQLVDERLKDYLAGITPAFESEHRIRHASGRWIWVSAKGKIIQRLEDGTPLRISGTMHDISDRKSAEEKKALLAAIVQSSDDAIIGLSMNGSITSWNFGAEKTYGYTENEIVGGPLSLLFRPEGEDDKTSILEKLRNGEHIEHFETIQQKKDGQFIYASLSSAPILDANGEIVAASIIVRDISSSKHAEMIMRARLRLLEYSVSHSTAESIRTAMDEIEKLTDSEIGFYFFLEPERKSLVMWCWIIKSDRNLCPASGDNCHCDIDIAGVWGDYVRDKKPVIHNDFVSLLNRKGMPDGHVPVNRELVVPIMRGETVVAIIGVANKASDYDENDIEKVSLLGDFSWDIIERKRAEDALRKSEERFRAIADYTSDWEYWIGPDGELLWVNPTVLRITGYTPEECAAMPDYPLPLVHDQDRTFISARFEEAKSGSSGDDVAFRARKKDGTVIWAAVSWQSILDEQDRNLGYRASVRDITDRVLAEKELARSLEEKVMLLKELKHRTKNNLSIVSSLLRFNIGEITDERACRILREAIDRIETISSIYEQLNLSDNIDILDLRAYVTNLVSSLDNTFSSGNSGITIKASVEDMDIKLRFAVPVGLILNELITNAYKYAFPSRKAGKIRVDISRAGGMVTMKVSDDGCGMPDGFDPEKSESLGLKIVSMFVQQLNGGFRFEAGKGTTAVITFPE
ncbi:MAG TPA: hypothetical protein DIC34_05185 [Treponema sp.]|nr:MAG: hypothetical protein A2001_14745 [Treponema sp. GWC1_61_84]OHE68867.1 MAG: hypothetical protein A2413_07585 [Treponema sp. RIFOXYC1_FULL_61_9]HCM25932.1 hypothetical protein [Treponema sp.]